MIIYLLNHRRKTSQDAVGVRLGMSCTAKRKRQELQDGIAAYRNEVRYNFIYPILKSNFFQTSHRPRNRIVGN